LEDKKMPIAGIPASRSVAQDEQLSDDVLAAIEGTF
jgi:hypothetical protein